MKDSIIKEQDSLLNRGLLHPRAAEGKVCIDLTDPYTGKVKQRVDGNNHVFMDSLIGYSGNSVNWVKRLSSVWTCLQDSDYFDATLPYLAGQTRGYGRPSTAGSGSYRGAYNSANQVLAGRSITSIRWKYQYDFTTAQANATFKSIGLTSQFAGCSISLRHPSFFPLATGRPAKASCDGRYTYTCSTAGVVSRYDNWLGTTYTKNVSATVGTDANTYKVAGPGTDGKYYVGCYHSSNSSLRKVHRFSDNTFDTFEQTYAASNLLPLYSNYPTYFTDSLVFRVDTSTSSPLQYCNYVTNGSAVTPTVTSYNYASATESTNAYYFFADTNIGTCLVGSLLFLTGSTGNNYTNVFKGMIYDLVNNAIFGYFGNPSPVGGAICLQPFSTASLLTATYASDADYQYHNAAATNYILPTPVTKTSANGMTVTYELEVFW